VETLPLIFQAADEMLYLQGEFSSHPTLSCDLRGKVDLSGSGSCDFQTFWSWFTGVCMANDLLKYSAIERGEQIKADEIKQLQEQEENQRQRAIERQRQAEEIAAFLEEYQQLREACLADKELNRILHEGQTLTGDLPPNGDLHYEDEIVPSGEHCALLRKICLLLGFPKREEPSVEPGDSISATGSKEVAEPRSMSKERQSKGSICSQDLQESLRKGSKTAEQIEPVEPINPDLFWSDDVADDWKILQEMIGTEMQDGVVDAQSLEAALPAPRAFLQLKRRVEDELERRRFQDFLDAEKKKDTDPRTSSMHEELSYEVSTGSRRSVDVMGLQAFDGVEISQGLSDSAKPSFEQLCRTHRMTMARMHWLHAQFVDFLPPGIDGVKQRCGYPENPAALSKEDVQNLMAEVKPETTLAEFEQKFLHIDADGSGELEFDEFVQWLGEDELELDAEADKTKPSKEDLADRFKVSLDRIDELHEAFASYLPEGEVDGYPEEPKALSKECILELVQKFAPDISEDEFDEQFRFIDMDNSQSIEFDEFLEFLDFEEIRGTEPTSPLSPY
jgi:Ca2+-binding EF-hand superfamily protein